MTAPISAFIRAKNEERMIGDVIRAAQQVASEVVVVDSGSTDKTIEIAEELGARVVRAPWLGGGKQKRLGEDACMHDWLLDLDADEIVTPELADEIRRIVRERRPPERPVYQMMMATAPPVGAVWRTSTWWIGASSTIAASCARRDHANYDQFDVPSGLSVGSCAPRCCTTRSAIWRSWRTSSRATPPAARATTKLKPIWLLQLRAAVRQAVLLS